MTLKTDQVISAFIVICAAFGVLVGFIGLGAGLVFLSVSQAIGIGILSAGIGAFFGMVLGAKRIMRALIATLEELEGQKRGRA